MKKNIYLTTIFTIMTFLTFCRGSNNSDQTVNHVNDSIQLTKLIREVYKWHMATHLDDFPYKYSDNIFTGIDWDKYRNNIEIFRKTNFFTDQFFIKHKTITLNIDSSIRRADIKWRNINDGIPIWDLDADYWCGCQDYPDNYWEILTISDLKIENTTARFYWTWDKSRESAPHRYKIVAEKIGNMWKINSLEGFDYFGSVDHYDKFMKE